MLGVGIFALGVGAARWRRASAATRTPADVTVPRPGDDLVPDAMVVLDRATVLPAAAERVWPWLVQLGKGRGGWYLPAAVEQMIPDSRRGRRMIDPSLQHVAVGDRVPDWGPGRPELEVVSIDPPRSLVFLSLRDRAAGHRWPTADPAAASTLRMSWSLSLDDLTNDRTRLHLRLRVAASGRVLHHLADPLDTATVLLLFAGLRERLRPRTRAHWALLRGSEVVLAVRQRRTRCLRGRP